MYRSLAAERADRYLSLYERATKTTTQLTGMPSGGGSDRNALLANLADSVEKVSTWVDILKQRQERVKEFLRDVPLNDTRRFILTQRYVLRSGWKPLFFQLQEMEKISERKMYYEHNRALEQCAQWVNTDGAIYKKEILDL